MLTLFREHVQPITCTQLGQPFEKVQKKVAELIKGRIVVGHALTNDFKALLLKHPASLVRDTAIYKPLRHPRTKRPQALRKLAAQILGVTIQSGEHSSVEDARAVMLVYKKHRAEWEQYFFRIKNSKRQHNTTTEVEEDMEED
jgi:RNA exonuclease 4